MQLWPQIIYLCGVSVWCEIFYSCVISYAKAWAWFNFIISILRCSYWQQANILSLWPIAFMFSGCITSIMITFLTKYFLLKVFNTYIKRKHTKHYFPSTPPAFPRFPNIGNHIPKWNSHQYKVNKCWCIHWNLKQYIVLLVTIRLHAH